MVLRLFSQLIAAFNSLPLRTGSFNANQGCHTFAAVSFAPIEPTLLAQAIRNAETELVIGADFALVSITLTAIATATV